MEKELEKDKVSKILEPFYMEDKSRSRKEGGISMINRLRTFMTLCLVSVLIFSGCGQTVLKNNTKVADNAAFVFSGVFAC